MAESTRSETPTESGKLLLVGGHSHLARAIAGTARSSRCRFVVRRLIDGDTDRDYRFVESYQDVPPACFDGIDTVVNCVGTTTPGTGSDSLRSVNVDVPVRTARAALEAGVSHFVQASSLSIYGGAAIMDETTVPSPTTAYGRSKLAAELELEELKRRGLRLAIVRLPAMYGYGAEGKLSRLARWMLKVRVFPVPDRLPPRSILHYENAGAAIVGLANHGATGSYFASDLPHFDLRALAEALHTQRNAVIHLIRFPRLFFSILERLAPDIHSSLYEPSVIAPAALDALPEPLPRSLSEGLREMVDNL